MSYSRRPNPVSFAKEPFPCDRERSSHKRQHPMSTSATKLCPLRFVWERFLLRPNQTRKRRTAATQIFLSPLPISTAIWRLTEIPRDSQREEMPKVRHSYIGCANLSQSLEPLFKSEVKPFGFVAGPTLIIHAFLHQQWEYPKKQRAVLGTCGFGLGWPQTLDVHPSSSSVPSTPGEAAP